ncbi:hypothetical protein BY458DRAFT_517566 [Sporodiniella umbellata]|nr:hypothetical protein BY458DRAFT_517566 [Sporodiniella umbellata]
MCLFLSFLSFLLKLQMSLLYQSKPLRSLTSLSFQPIKVQLNQPLFSENEKNERQLLKQLSQLELLLKKSEYSHRAKTQQNILGLQRELQQYPAYQRLFPNVAQTVSSQRPNTMFQPIYAIASQLYHLADTHQDESIVYLLALFYQSISQQDLFVYYKATIEAHFDTIKQAVKQHQPLAHTQREWYLKKTFLFFWWNNDSSF